MRNCQLPVTFKLNIFIFRQVACAVPLALMGTSFQFFTYSSALIYFLVVIVYGIVYFLLKSNQASKISNLTKWFLEIRNCVKYWKNSNLKTNSTQFMYVFFTFTKICYLCLVWFLSINCSYSGARFKSVFRSILVTVGFVLFGWVTTTLTNTLSYEITSVAFTAQLMQMYAGITVNFAAASNAFIFYAIK